MTRFLRDKYSGEITDTIHTNTQGVRFTSIPTQTHTAPEPPTQNKRTHTVAIIHIIGESQEGQGKYILIPARREGDSHPPHYPSWFPSSLLCNVAVEI